MSLLPFCVDASDVSDIRLRYYYIAGPADHGNPARRQERVTASPDFPERWIFLFCALHQPGEIRPLLDAERPNVAHGGG
jgi:hypothetical protein